MKKNLFWVVGILAVLAFCATASAEYASDAKMANEALGPFINSKASQAKQNARIERFHSAIADRTRLDPKGDMTATVIFRTGMTVPQIGRLVADLDLEVMKMHVKAPYNDRGAIQSVEFGPADLVRYQGGFEARAKRAIGVMRYNFLRWSEDLPEREAENHQAIARGPMLIYRCEVLGKAESIYELVPNKTVAQSFQIAPAGLQEGSERVKA